MCTKKHNIVEQTFYRWHNKYGGLEVSDARKLKELESENTKLKRIVAEQMLGNRRAEGVLRKKMSTPTGRREAL